MNSYFKGWYFKLQNKKQTLAIIPSLHTDKHGKGEASIYVVSDSGVWNKQFSKESFVACKKNLPIKVDKSIFSNHGIILDIQDEDFTIRGKVKFSQLTPIKYDIMGPFSIVPFMECRHSVLSMTHRVDGRITVNGESYVFDNAVGYIEGDRGSSFPSNYAWTQCNFYNQSHCSVFLSVANIPIAFTSFTGVIGIVLWRGEEYRIATYLGATATKILDGRIVIKQGEFTITTILIEEHPRPLYAPVRGDMTRTIKESPSCTAYYKFEKGGETLFEFITKRASFEYEYDK